MTADAIARLAYEALMDEVRATPKPGLVDLNNNGAHRDMDAETFARSARTLRPHFEVFARLGYDTADMPPQRAFSALREPGIKAEREMFAETGGVNTHKGAIFSLGLLCAAAGRLQALGQELSAQGICRAAGCMAAGVSRELRREGGELSKGELAFARYGVKGARGEAESGFESVMTYGYPALKSLIQGADRNTAHVLTLVSLMTHVTDTNVISRRGLEAAIELKAWAAELGENPPLSKVEQLDSRLIGLNISPGGCADLLAASIFLYEIEQI